MYHTYCFIRGAKKETITINGKQHTMLPGLQTASAHIANGSLTALLLSNVHTNPPGPNAFATVYSRATPVN